MSQLYNETAIQKIILEIVAHIAPDEDVSGIDPQEPLRKQLELDSMDFLDIVMELRKRYKIEVPEADYGHLASLKSCSEYLLPIFNRG